jgi:hypothetical protein
MACYHGPQSEHSVMIQYTTDNGIYSFPTARLALLNWYVDLVESNFPSGVVVFEDPDFIPQMLATVERSYGRLPRIDKTQDVESQSVEMLQFVAAYGGLKDLLLEHSAE